MIEDYKDQIARQNRYYLRFHLTIKKAIQLNKEIYGDKKTKDGTQFRFQHSIRIAGFTEEIKSQGIASYHLTWLLGILHDAFEDAPILYSEKIDEVLDDLLPEQSKTIKNYVRDLSSDRALKKGDQKRQAVQRMDKLDLIPCWIKIFDKYDNCLRFKKNNCNKNQKELKGYYAVAYLCFHKAIMRHLQIGKNLSQTIKDFFRKLQQELGGMKQIVKLAQEYYKLQ